MNDTIILIGLTIMFTYLMILFVPSMYNIRQQAEILLELSNNGTDPFSYQYLNQ